MLTRSETRRQTGVLILTTGARRIVSHLRAVLLVAALVCPAVHAQNQKLPRIGDAAGAELSPATERRIGEAVMRGLRRDRAMVDDPELSGYLNEFAFELTDTVAARGFQFEFFLLRDPTLNAFALPGGYIGVHSGLLLASSTESELASVLAHEIGHVTQRHVARMLARGQRTSVLSLAAVFMAMLAAGSSSDAAAGLVALGSSVYEQQMLSFSRDAEREADRIGLEILREANFNPNDMIAFFGRMQQATRLYESNAPSYLRTHPLTTNRMADIQNRVINFRYRQRASSLSFHLVKAKLQAQASTSKDALQAARKRFETRIAERTFLSETATWYGLAVVAAAQRDWPSARRAIKKARSAARVEGHGDSHAFFERMNIEIELEDGNLAKARSMVEQALRQYPSVLALRLQRIDISLRARQFDLAATQIHDELRLHPSEAMLWNRLGKTYAGLGKTGLSHWAIGERYRLLGGWRAALEQFRLARKDKTIDFYRLSQIDARIGATEQQIREENEARQRVQ